MKYLLVLTVCWLTVPWAAFAKINVVATLPDFGSIAEAVGGEHVKVTTIARGSEDPHFVDARPSFIRVLNQADVLIEGGAELEIGWLPPLVNAARNSRILGDAPGHLIVGRSVELLEIPRGAIDRSMGDVHAAGNPHFWLDPLNGKIIARKIAEVLQKVDAPNAATYGSNLKAFTDKLDALLPGWQRKLEPFRGTKVITYHKSYEYFAHRFGLEIVAQLEPRPGIEPSAVHINTLVQRAKSENVKLVLIEPFRRRSTAQQVASNIGAKLLVLPNMVNGVPAIKDYPGEFEYLVNAIAAALSSDAK